MPPHRKKPLGKQGLPPSSSRPKKTCGCRVTVVAIRFLKARFMIFSPRPSQSMMAPKTAACSSPSISWELINPLPTLSARNLQNLLDLPTMPSALPARIPIVARSLVPTSAPCISSMMKITNSSCTGTGKKHLESRACLYRHHARKKHVDVGLRWSR